MGGFSKKILLFTFLIVCSLTALAQKVAFEVGAPNMVAVGEMFRVEFSVNAKAEAFKQPTMPKELGLLAGPTQSSGMSVNIVNGDMTRTVNTTYTYVFQAVAEGKAVLSGAEVKVDGKVYTTPPVTIDVVAEGGSASGGGAQTGGSTVQQGTSSSSGQQPTKSIAADDIIISASVNQQNVYKGQPVKLTLKLYKRVSLSGVSGTKLPAFNGFWSQELPQNPNRQWQRETYNSKVYDAMVIGEYLLYPQQSGTLQIDPFELTVVAQIVTQAQRQSMLDDFFGGGPSVQEVHKELRTRAISVNVKDFPAGAPASFNGAVGDFSLDSNISSRTVAANSAATYTLKISGSGNLPLIQAPKLALPGSFEQYNIKTTESLSNTSAGTNGYRQFEYPFIARAEGAYTVEPIEFTYFNPASARYVTLTTPAVELNITPDEGGSARTASGGIVSGLTKEDIKILGSDIRFIKIGAPGFHAKNALCIGSVWYFALLLLIVALAVVFYYMMRNHIRQMGNLAVVKGKRANKAALGRFRAAERFKREGDRRRFLEEMLRALWGYMGDRLNIPVADLTKDNVREKLTRRGVPAQHTERYINVISDCEMAQYSPATSGEMDTLYREGVEAISAMESILK